MKKALRFGSTTIRVETSTLQNGITVASARSQRAPELSVGIAVFDGSRHETKKNNGSRHFLEHLISTKGSPQASGYKIAGHIEENGGEINAETSQESTIYYVNGGSWARTRDFFLHIAPAVINPKFTPENVERERHVVLAEIKGYMDCNQEYAYIAMMRTLFPDTTTGLPIGACPESVNKITYEQLRGIHEQRYTPRRIVVFGVGNLRHEELRRVADRALGHIKDRRVNNRSPQEKIYNIGQAVKILERSSGNASHVLIGFNASPSIHSNKERYALLCIEALLGDGSTLSTRLFQALREQQGIGYGPRAVFDLSQGFSTFHIETDCDDCSDISRARETIISEIRRLCECRVSKKEIRSTVERVRHKIRENLIDEEKLRNELLLCTFWKKPHYFFREYQTLQDLTPADIQEVAQKYFTLDNCAAVIIRGMNISGDHAQTAI